MEFDRIPEIAKYLSLVYLLAWLGRSTVWNFLPLYFERHISSVFLIGVLSSLPAAVPLILDIPVGNLVQRAGEKIVIMTGLFIGLSTPILYFTAIPVLLAVGKITEGVTKSLIWNGGWNIALKSADEDVESEAISVFLLGVNIAIVIGPVIGGYLITFRGFNLTFGLWLGSWFLSILVFLTYIGLEGKRGFVESLEELFHRRTYDNDFRHLKQNWSKIKFPLTLSFLYSIIFSFYWLAVPLLLDKLSADFITMGIIFGIIATPKIFQFLFGDLADIYGNMNVLILLSFLITPVLVILSFINQIVFIGGLLFLARVFSSGMSPPIHAYFDSKVDEEVESELFGFFEFSKHTGQTIGPIIAGTVASIWSINASFLAAAGISTLILVLSLQDR